ncbi:MAG: hypothetical protein LBR11_12770 [Deltaproteobacteria bacterium]|nr:hypothetical protein [Deltaproteobacteria bacterium]
MAGLKLTLANASFRRIAYLSISPSFVFFPEAFAPGLLRKEVFDDWHVQR